MVTEPTTLTPPAPEATRDGSAEVVLDCREVWIRYGDKPAVQNVSLRFPKNKVTALIGPSGCGKSTLLRCFNRMNEFIPGCTVSGEILYHGANLYGRDVDPVEVRRRIGMVFQKPNPFPKSIYENIAWGPKINGLAPRSNRRQWLDDLVEQSLRQAGLWDEVKDRLHESGLSLSGGQQQRLCIARTLAMDPEVILMDEPCSALDPRSTLRIEDLIDELNGQYSILIVTHNMQQAGRVSDFTAFLYEGELIEFGETDVLFTNPTQQQTEDYITGRFG